MLDKFLIETFFTDAYICAQANKHHSLTEDKRAIILGNRKKKIHAFSTSDLNKYLDSYEEIVISGIIDQEYLKFINGINRSYGYCEDQLIVLRFDSPFFQLKGKKNKKLRRFWNYYSKMDNIEVYDSPRSSNDFNNFLKNWKQMRSGKIPRPIIGTDKNFLYNYALKEIEKYMNFFFYLDGELSGYCIVERIYEDCYNILFRKAYTTLNHFGLYIDLVVYKKIFDMIKRDFFVFLGSTSGVKGLLEEKMRDFPVYRIVECQCISLRKNQK